MFGIQEFYVFLATAIVLNLTPGADTLYIVSRSIAQGRSAGVASVLGISTGSLVHTLAGALGLSALFLVSSWAFLAVKVLGAVYLIYLGIGLLVRKTRPVEVATDFQDSRFLVVFRQGLLTNILNPKVALFFLALVPQFISSDSPSKFLSFVLLGMCFVATGTIWCLLVVLISASLSGRFRSSSKMSRLLNRITGLIFIGLGIRVAATP